MDTKFYDTTDYRRLIECERIPFLRHHYSTGTVPVHVVIPMYTVQLYSKTPTIQYQTLCTYIPTIRNYAVDYTSNDNQKKHCSRLVLRCG